jgi:hypothetical protein
LRLGRAVDFFPRTWPGLGAFVLLPTPPVTGLVSAAGVCAVESALAVRSAAGGGVARVAATEGAADASLASALLERSPKCARAAAPVKRTRPPTTKLTTRCRACLRACCSGLSTAMGTRLSGGIDSTRAPELWSRQNSAAPKSLGRSWNSLAAGGSVALIADAPQRRLRPRQREQVKTHSSRLVPWSAPGSLRGNPAYSLQVIVHGAEGSHASKRASRKDW